MWWMWASLICHLLNNHIVNKPSKEKIKEIFLSAFEIEKEFITESLPVSLIGMNKELMIQYIEYVVDQLLQQLGVDPHFNSKNPFDFMINLNLDKKNGRPYTLILYHISRVQYHFHLCQLLSYLYCFGIYSKVV